MWHGVVGALGMLAAATIGWMLVIAMKAGADVASGNLRAYQVPGLPFIGNTLGLARHGASFIHNCRLQVHECHHRALHCTELQLASCHTIIWSQSPFGW